MYVQLDLFREKMAKGKREECGDIISLGPRCDWCNVTLPPVVKGYKSFERCTMIGCDKLICIQCTKSHPKEQVSWMQRRYARNAFLYYPQKQPLKIYQTCLFK